MNLDLTSCRLNKYAQKLLAQVRCVRNLNEQFMQSVPSLEKFSSREGISYAYFSKQQLLLAKTDISIRYSGLHSIFDSFEICYFRIVFMICAASSWRRCLVWLRERSVAGIEY